MRTRSLPVHGKILFLVFSAYSLSSGTRQNLVFCFLRVLALFRYEAKSRNSFVHRNRRERADFHADAAAFAMIQIKISALSGRHRNTAVRTAGCAQQTLLALIRMPDRRIIAPLSCLKILRRSACKHHQTFCQAFVGCFLIDS